MRAGATGGLISMSLWCMLHARGLMSTIVYTAGTYNYSLLLACACPYSTRRLLLQRQQLGEEGVGGGGATR